MEIPTTIPDITIVVIFSFCTDSYWPWDNGEGIREYGIRINCSVGVIASDIGDGHIVIIIKGVSDGVFSAVGVLVDHAVANPRGVPDELGSPDTDELTLADEVRDPETDRVWDRVGVRVRDEVWDPLAELDPDRLGDELAVLETEADELLVPDGLWDGDSDALGVWEVDCDCDGVCVPDACCVVVLVSDWEGLCVWLNVCVGVVLHTDLIAVSWTAP